MSLLIDDLTSWWAERAGVAVGEGLFAGLMPESGELVSSIRQTGGPERGVDAAATYTFQVTTRGCGLTSVLDRATDLYNALYPGGLPWRNVALSDSWRLLAIDAIQPPTDLGVDERDGARRIVFNVAARAGKLT